MLHKSDTPIACGVGDCTFTHEYPTVVGRHRRSAHGVVGNSASSQWQRAEKRAETRAEKPKAPKTKVSFKPSKTAKPAKRPYTRKASHVEIDPLLPHTTYLSGYISGFVASYSRGHDISAEVLTRRLGSILNPQAVR